MDNRQLKKDCYLDLLDDAIVDVEAIYNQLNRNIYYIYLLLLYSFYFVKWQKICLFNYQQK